MKGDLCCVFCLFILAAANYFTRLVEAVPLNEVNENVIMDFIEQHLVTRFGVASIILFYNASYFSSLALFEFALDKGIVSRCVANYYPWGNGFVESTNKILICILKKIVIENHRN